MQESVLDGSSSVVQNVSMARQSVYPLLDRLADGKLTEQLLEHRDRGESHLTIAFWLHDTYEVDVTSQTIRRWLIAIDEAQADAEQVAS